MKALVPVLSSLDIHHAISLDDDYSMASQMGSPELISIEDFFHACDEEFTEAERNSIEDSGVSTIEDIFQSDFLPQELKDKVAQVLSSKVKPVAALSFLESGFKDSDISYETLDDVCEIENAPDIGTIWFLDREMGNRDVLPEVIPNIINKHHQSNNPYLIVVFTLKDELASLNCSWLKRFEYLKKLDIQADLAQELSYSFFVLSKKEIGEKLSIDEGSALRYVTKILMNSFSGLCLYHIISKMKNYTSRSYNHLFEVVRDSTQATIENIRYNMVTEGEPNVYHALKNIQALMQEQEYTVSLADCAKYILAMKRIALLPEDSSEIIAARTIDDVILLYEWTQFQFMHRDANVVFSDVSYGDIFKVQYALDHVNLKTYIGVLVTQPCDCIIRKDKKRVKRSAQALTLLLFDEKTISRNTLLDQEQKGWEQLIRRIRNEAIFIEQAKRDDGDWSATYIQASASVAAIQINPFILDLTSLNPQGKAKVSSSQELQQVVQQRKTQNWISFLPTFTSALVDFEKKQKILLEEVQEQAEDFLRLIYGIPFSIKRQEFSVERIGHIETNLTELISYHYVSRTYRTGKNSLIALHDDRDE